MMKKKTTDKDHIENIIKKGTNKMYNETTFSENNNGNYNNERKPPL